MKVGQEFSFSPYNSFFGAHIPNPVCKDRMLSSSAKLIYGRMVEFSQGKSTCFPSLTQLAEATGLSRPLVVKAVKDLEKQGYIKVTRPTKAKRIEHLHNLYTFLWHRTYDFANDDKKRKRTVGQPSDQGGQPSDLCGNTSLLPNKEVIVKKRFKEKIKGYQGGTPLTPAFFEKHFERAITYVDDPVSLPPTFCPECEGKVKEKAGEYGLFFGCSNYPDCHWSWSQKRKVA